MFMMLAFGLSLFAWHREQVHRHFSAWILT